MGGHLTKEQTYANTVYKDEWDALHKQLKGKTLKQAKETFDSAFRLCEKEYNEGLIYVSLNDNDKIGGKSLHFSTLPGVTCDKRAKCLKNKLCYDLIFVWYYFGTFRARTRNTWILRNHPEMVTEALENAAKRHRKIFQAFRVYAGGDVENVKQAKLFVKFANEHPDIPSWTYTKRYKVWNKIKDTGNLSVRYSEDKCGLKMDNPYNRPLAIVDSQKSNCPNQLRGIKCSQCLMCLKSKVDVIFKAHGTGRKNLG